ncbi:MAG: sialate O-acetylesterase [Mucilaginibacter polytrichastri]|nr:sialate O-acetylesterase [Mucilaginibacter polytrichastri]
MKNRFLLCSFCACFFAHASFADVKPVSLFSDHMILQQGKPVSVWGDGDEGEKITVSFNGKEASTVVQNGHWMVKLPKMRYTTTPAALTIKGKNTVTINDVLVGEVWICSGQSNMERKLRPWGGQKDIVNWQQERDSANFPLIRQYFVPEKYSGDRLRDANSNWSVCSPSTVGEFSAVGFFFARDLYKKLKVPVGILFTAYGGTPAEDWTSREALKADSVLAHFVPNEPELSNPANGKPRSGLFNTMINPLLPYTIKGAAWYQGEANSPRAEQYQHLLTKLIANWRQDFGQGDFPFLIVQIAPHKVMRPEIREAQLKVSETVKNTALIVTTDCGDSTDIHPAHKQPVGERLALAARALAYGDKIEYSGPVYQSMAKQGANVILSFSHAKKGFAKEATLKGFTLAGANNKYFSAAAEVRGNKIVVHSNDVKEPMAVRYGWANVPDVNLFNAEGLPASPFRTE